MPTLRLEHSVPNFEKWKQAFDADPVDRKGSGVRRFQILCSRDDPNYVMIDLEFDSIAEAESFRTRGRTQLPRCGLLDTPSRCELIFIN